MLSASSGGIMVLLITSRFSRKDPLYDVSKLCNGILSGLVAITGPCGYATNFSSIIIGCLGGCAYVWFSKIVVYMKIDDPLDVFSIHYGAGLTGLLCIGFFHTKKGVFYGYGGE